SGGDSNKPEPVPIQLKRELVHANAGAHLRSLRFSPDGKQLIAGDYPGGVVMVWDVASGKQLVKIETGFGYRGSADYGLVSPDWRTLFVSRLQPKFEAIDVDGTPMTRRNFD